MYQRAIKMGRALSGSDRDRLDDEFAELGVFIAKHQGELNMFTVPLFLSYSFGIIVYDGSILN